MGLDMFLMKMPRTDDVNSVPHEDQKEVGYWRKANHIHKWFVDNVQDGIDDCDFHNEVTPDHLRNLRTVCGKVIKASELVNGKVENGQKRIGGQWVPIIENGKVIKDPTTAKELLPTTDGFFFGGTDYDEYYIDQIYETLNIISDALVETDFENEMLYYCSSW